MFRYNIGWYDLLSPEEQNGEEIYNREDLLDFLQNLSTYELSSAMIAQNVLTMLNDTVFDELILEKDEEMMFRKAESEEDVKETTPTLKIEHDYLLKPNLFDGKLYANITLQAEEQGKLEIYNLQGVLVGNLQLMNGKNELDLTPMNLPNGVYLYRVWANDEIKHSDKLIKLK
jgi:hypothetical protein